MAEMIPDRLPSRASRGEEIVFDLLKRLPDDCLVYYEPVISDRYPDFLLVLPRHGLLIIEVKGWYPKAILEADQETVLIQERGQESRAKHPIAQARDYVNRLLDQARQPGFAPLRHPDGAHQGRLRFPIGHIAVLSNIRSGQLAARFPGEALERLFPPQRVIFRDVLDGWSGLEPGALLDLLGGLIAPSWPIAPLGRAEIDCLRGLLHPEIRLPRLASAGQGGPVAPAAAAAEAEPAGPDGEGAATADSVAVLDLKQERNALNLGLGHRILYGVAGSGKTVILLARARHLAEQDPSKRILVLCYNVVLANFLRRALESYANIECYNFHAWCARYAPASVSGVRGGEDTESVLGRRMLAALEVDAAACSRRYDAILVDEAQDFDRTWFPCLVEALADPEDGDLLIVADGAQSLYRRAGFTWSGVGIKARGRTVSTRFDLQTNYRNAREIVELSRAFLTPPETGSAADEDAIGTIGAEQLQASRSTGLPPLLLSCFYEERQEIAIAGVVKDLLVGTWLERALGQPLRPGEIAILYRGLFAGYRPRLARLLSALRAQTDVLWVNDPDDRSAKERLDQDAVKVMTVHAAKGLQFRAVLVPWLESFTALRGRDGYDEAVERRLLYVAMTRAMDFLCLSGPADHGLVRELQGLGDGLVVRES